MTTYDWDVGIIFLTVMIGALWLFLWSVRNDDR